MRTFNTQIIKYGALVFLGLMSYFLIMDAFDLVHNLNLRIFNAVIMFSGIFLLLKRYKKQDYDKPFSYLNGLTAGFFVTLIGTGAFAIFMTIYLLMNPEFVIEIKETEPQGMYLNIPAMVMLILIEGIGSGILFTYTSMQFLKADVAVEGNRPSSAD